MADKTRSSAKHKSVKCKTQPLCARTTYSCCKLLLFLYALCYLAVGAILLGVGIVVEIERQDFSELDTTLSLPVACLIFVGLWVLINGLCGVVGTVQENTSLIRLFFILSIFSFLAQIAIAIVIYVYITENKVFISSDLAPVLRHYNTKPKLRMAMDKIQTKFTCCGITSWQDYVNIADVCTESGKCVFPWSCCIKPNRLSVSVSVLSCASNSLAEVPPSMTSKAGCFDAFSDWFHEQIDLIGALSLGLALPQVAGIIWTYLVLRRIREYHCLYTVELADTHENDL